MVDKTTGFVQALRPLDVSTIDPDAALTQSFLVQYVIARESFDMATLRTNYRKVALFSADAARNSYLDSMPASSPQSPFRLYPRTTTVDARVKSVSSIGAHAALVRFDTARTDAGGDEQSPRSWVAVVQYRYAREPMSLEDRFVNPLGFQVTSYRKDPETASAVETIASSSAAAVSTPSGYYSSFAQQALPQQTTAR
jgi:type IV secretion system protein VirB8